MISVPLHRTRVGVLLVIVTLANPAHAQFTVSGTVTDPLQASVDSVSIRLFDGLGNPIGIPPTFTDVFGFYSIAGLPPGTYGIGFAPKAATKLVPTIEQGVVVIGNATLDMSLELGNLLSGFVRDSTGVGLFDIDLKVEDRRTNEVLFTPGDNTDASGFYDVVVPTGEYDLKWRAVASGSPPWIPVEMRNVCIATDTTIDVTMILGVFVSGGVQDLTASPVFNVNLDFIDVATGVKLDTPGDNTGLTGFYQVHVPKLTYDIRAKPLPAARLLGAEILAVPITSDTTVNFVLEPGLLLSGLVHDPAGVGVFDVEIDVVDSATGVEVFTPFDNTDLLGNYAVVVPPGVYDIAYRPPVSTLLAPVQIFGVSVAVDTNVNTALPNGLLLSGVVQDAGGLGVPGVDIDAKVSASGLGVPLVGDVTDVTGAFEVVVAPGVYDLEFEPPSVFGLVAKRLLAVPLSLDTFVAVTLEPGVRVSGTVTDSAGAFVPGADVDVIVSSSGVEILTPGDNSDALGHYEVIVPPDTYTLICTPDPLVLVAAPVVMNNVTVVVDMVVDFVFPSRITTDARDLPGPVPPGALALHQNHPNPFNPSTIIRYDLGRAGMLSLGIYDARGALVRELYGGHQVPGRYEVRWDGTDTHGRRVSSGIYVYRLRLGDASEARKMLLLK